jgi:hypothetical protein
MPIGVEHLSFVFIEIQGMGVSIFVSGDQPAPRGPNRKNKNLRWLGGDVCANKDFGDP